METEAEQGLQEVEEGSTNTGRKGWGERETLRSSGLVVHQGQRLILRKGGREKKRACPGLQQFRLYVLSVES